MSGRGTLRRGTVITPVFARALLGNGNYTQGIIPYDSSLGGPYLGAATIRITG
jgi:hypothetical protein